ncbi:alpha/beta fold hydrolase [Jatrophihabitans sp. YIM 134969]
MPRSRVPYRLSNARTVLRTAATANGPRRFRPSPDAAAPAVIDTTTRLPELDLTLPPWPGEEVEVGGARLFVRHTPTTATGEVPTAVFVHGLGGASTNWTDLGAQLRGHVDAYAPDLPGFGRSGPSPTGEYSIRTHAQVVTAYLERVVAERGAPVHLFGNSMGGAISIRVAARRPDLVRTLTLISPAVPDLRVKRDDDPRTPLLLVPGIAGMAQKRIAAVPARVRAKALVEMVFGDPSRVPDHRIEEAAAELKARGDEGWTTAAFNASMKGLVATWFTATPWRDLAAITAPTLVIWGDRDKLVSPALAPRVATTLPRARLLVLAGAGHVAMMEEPVMTARAWLGTLGDGSVLRASGDSADSVRS